MSNYSIIWVEVRKESMVMVFCCAGDVECAGPLKQLDTHSRSAHQGGPPTLPSGALTGINMAPVSFQILSDLHLEIHPSYDDFQFQNKASYLALLGDIGHVGTSSYTNSSRIRSSGT
jgi:hypothetical protein